MESVLSWFNWVSNVLVVRGSPPLPPGPAGHSQIHFLHGGVLLPTPGGIWEVSVPRVAWSSGPELYNGHFIRYPVIVDFSRQTEQSFPGPLHSCKSYSVSQDLQLPGSHWCRELLVGRCWLAKVSSIIPLWSKFKCPKHLRDCRSRSSFGTPLNLLLYNQLAISRKRSQDKVSSSFFSSLCSQFGGSVRHFSRHAL